VQQAAIGDCLSFDPFPFDQNGLAPPEVDVGGRQVADALMIAQVIVVSDEGRDLGFKIARQVIVLEQDAVLERLMPALDLSLGHRIIRRAADMPHVLAVEPFGQVRRDIAGGRLRSPFAQGWDQMDAMVIGIDVSKNRLDVAVRPTGESLIFKRTGVGIEDLIARREFLWESVATKWNPFSSPRALWILKLHTQPPRYRVALARSFCLPTFGLRHTWRWQVAFGT
jgi:hypothetical protein